jgi:hypothetical protein
VLVVGMAAVVVAPWVVRNKVQVGCYAITTDSRALWKANNENTRGVLDRGGWIDDVPALPGAPPWPEYAADLTLAGKPTTIDECADAALPRRGRRFLARAARREGASRRCRRPGCSGSPVRASRTRAERNGAPARRTIEPAFMVGLYALAVVGVFVAPPTSSASPRSCLAYNTLAAMVFAGTARIGRPGTSSSRSSPLSRCVSLERIQRRRHRHYVGVGSRARA